MLDFSTRAAKIKSLRGFYYVSNMSVPRMQTVEIMRGVSSYFRMVTIPRKRALVLSQVNLM